MNRFVAFFIIILVLLTSCIQNSIQISDKTGDTTNGKLPEKKSIEKQENIRKDPEDYTELQFDFNGYSTEGGLIFAYFNKLKSLVYFEVYIFGEYGKVVYRFDLIDANTIAVIEKEYAYENSIAESEGDIKIISQKESKYMLKNKKIVEPENKWIPTIFTEAMKIIEGSK